jgi:hypothetical protein
LIREAVYEDLEDVGRLAMDFINSLPYSHRQSTSGCMELGLELINNPHGCLFVAEENAKVIGFIAGLASVNPVTNLSICCELAWWVDPEYRNCKDGIMLLKAYEDWADQYETVTVTSLNSQSIHSLLKRRGYHAQETIYTR